jgi:hypothetical protein
VGDDPRTPEEQSVDLELAEEARRLLAAHVDDVRNESEAKKAVQAALDRWEEARVRWGPVVADTSIRIKPWPELVARLDEVMFGWTMERIEADRAEYSRLSDAAILDPTKSLQAGLEARIGAPIQALVVPWGGPRTGGPLPSQSEIVYLLGLAGDVVGRAVDLAAAFVLIKGGLAWLADTTQDRVLINDGVAILAAADAVWAATGANDLTLAFATPLSAHRVELDDFDPGDDGYLIGFRDASNLVVVRVDSFGSARILDGAIPLPERSRRTPST